MIVRDVDVTLEVPSESADAPADEPVESGDPGMAAPRPETPRSMPDTGGVLEPFLAAGLVALALAAFLRRHLQRVSASAPVAVAGLHGPDGGSK